MLLVRYFQSYELGVFLSLYMQFVIDDQRILFSQRPSWWPFEMSPGTLAFAIIWPFIAQWLVHLYYQRRR